MSIVHHKKKSRGFTLIELLVVISIIGLLSSIVLASVAQARKKALVTVTAQELRQYLNAISQYMIDNNGYPLTTNGTANCLGHYKPDNSCNPDGSGVKYESATLNAQLLPYIALPQITPAAIPISGNSAFGASYNCYANAGICTAPPSIIWITNGTNCIIQGGSTPVTGYTDGVNSVCQYTF
jgi:prepilin-type N-terminal cleavage/methylation domain-containing protein